MLLEMIKLEAERIDNCIRIPMLHPVSNLPLALPFASPQRGDAKGKSVSHTETQRQREVAGKLEPRKTRNAQKDHEFRVIRVFRGLPDNLRGPVAVCEHSELRRAA